MALGACRNGEHPWKDRNPFKELAFDQRIYSILFLLCTQGLALSVQADIRFILYFWVSSLILILLFQPVQRCNHGHVPLCQSVSLFFYGLEASLFWLSFQFTWWMLSPSHASCPFPVS